MTGLGRTTCALLLGLALTHVPSAGDSLARRVLAHSGYADKIPGVELSYEQFRNPRSKLLQRVIVSRPLGAKGRLRAVFFVPWLSCDSIEVPLGARGGIESLLYRLASEPGLVSTRGRFQSACACSASSTWPSWSTERPQARRSGANPHSRRSGRTSPSASTAARSASTSSFSGPTWRPPGRRWTAPTLAIWGEADLIMAREERERVVALVNRNRPGAGRLVTVADMDHSLSRSLPDGTAGLPEGLGAEILAWLWGVALGGSDAGPGAERGDLAR